MIFWNFKTPVTLLASLVWNTSEYFYMPLGKSAPYVFSLAFGYRGKKKSTVNNYKLGG